MSLKKINVAVFDVERLDKKSTFKSYSAYSNEGKKICNLKFLKDCENVPTESGVIYVLEEDLFRDKKSEYLRYCVKNIQRFEPQVIAITKEESPFDSVEE